MSLKQNIIYSCYNCQNIFVNGHVHSILWSTDKRRTNELCLLPIWIYFHLSCKNSSSWLWPLARWQKNDIVKQETEYFYNTATLRILQMTLNTSLWNNNFFLLLKALSMWPFNWKRTHNMTDKKNNFYMFVKLSSFSCLYCKCVFKIT